MTGGAFKLHPEAAADITEIWEYLAARSVQGAATVRADIFATLKTLADAPLIGHHKPELTSRPIRFHTVRDYLIAYAPDERPIWVLGVLHGRRSPRVMASLLRGREEPPG